MLYILDIIQELSWEFKLKNWPASISMKYDDVHYLYGSDFYDIEEFDIEKANVFYWK